MNMKVEEDIVWAGDNRHGSEEQRKLLDIKQLFSQQRGQGADKVIIL